jgi:hypothetical protein
MPALYRGEGGAPKKRFSRVKVVYCLGGIIIIPICQAGTDPLGVRLRRSSSRPHVRSVHFYYSFERSEKSEPLFCFLEPSSCSEQRRFASSRLCPCSISSDSHFFVSFISMSFSFMQRTRYEKAIYACPFRLILHPGRLPKFPGIAQARLKQISCSSTRLKPILRML